MPFKRNNQDLLPYNDVLSRFYQHDVVMGMGLYTMGEEQLN
jgi:hypothetical protein